MLRPIASGGMGSVHLGRLVGEAGFSRVVAIKVLKSCARSDPDAGKMFLDEARLAAHVRHPNVVSTLDVVEADGETILVMEYVHGLSLARLTRREGKKLARPPLRIVSAIMCGVLYGLHAAHEAEGPSGKPLGLIHRDVSPQNVVVGRDGLARLADFGIAKGAGRSITTVDGGVKGKIRYMAPEQLGGDPLDRRADIFSAGIVLWELLTGSRLFDRPNEAETLLQILTGAYEPPSVHAGPLPDGLDALVMRCLAKDAEDRPATAREVARALEACIPPASPIDVGDWVTSVAGHQLDEQASIVREIEATEIDAVLPTTVKKKAKTPELTFGLYMLEEKRMLAPVLDTFCGWLSEELGARVTRTERADYHALTDAVTSGSVDIAWLAPIVLIRVGDVMTPVVASARGNRLGYHTAFVVTEDSPLQSLDQMRGARVAWVDRWSAAGYVVPRVQLRLQGLDPKTLFGSEGFYGTHSAAVRAVVEREADVAATYAYVDDSGQAVNGAWSVLPDARVRVLATFGEIPPDVIAIRATHAPELRERLRSALHAGIASRSMRPILESLFGARGFRDVPSAAYDDLRSALRLAESLGLVD